MGRNLSQNHSLPDNPLFVSIDSSDGSSSVWPQNTTEHFNSNGEVNWMERLSLDHPTSLKWRTTIGRGLAAHCNLPGDYAKYVLKDWPAQYALFDHHKGFPPKERHDAYLYGSRSKYRSSAEFIPHAIWLITPPTQRADCGCKYCSGKSQREISNEMAQDGIYHASTPHLFAHQSRRPQPKKKTKIHDIGLYATVQKVLKPKLSQTVSRNPMVVERYNDLRAVNSLSKMRRWHRQHEMVWVLLAQPIRGTGEHQCIKFWPGIVRDIKVQKRAIRKPTPPTDSQVATSSSDQGMPVNSEAESVILPEREPPPWSVEERQLYRIQLLGVTAACILSERHVLPYQAYAQPAGLLDVLASTPPGQFSFDENISDFDPYSPSATWDEAFSHYVVGIEIAGSTSSYWNLTDEWEVKYSTAPPPSPAASVTAPVPRPIQNGLSMAAAASENGAESLSMGPSNIPERPAKRHEPSVNVMHFQGLWWGAERIWTDELVRLKAPRKSVAPDGTENIFKPSLPGPRRTAECLKEGKDLKENGAYGRGMFLLLQRIFVTESAKKECRIAGTLYELADDDWVDDSEEPVRAVNSDTARFADMLSHPPPATLLPRPPVGYKFRPIIRSGDEAIFSVALLSGRYYPGVLQEPLLAPEVTNMLVKEQTDTDDANLLWALEGLVSGIFNSVEPLHYSVDRAVMLEEADRKARALLKEFMSDKLKNEQDVAMDVDSVA